MVGVPQSEGGGSKRGYKAGSSRKEQRHCYGCTMEQKMPVFQQDTNGLVESMKLSLLDSV